MYLAFYYLSKNFMKNCAFNACFLRGAVYNSIGCCKRVKRMSFSSACKYSKYQPDATVILIHLSHENEVASGNSSYSITYSRMRKSVRIFCYMLLVPMHTDTECTLVLSTRNCGLIKCSSFLRLKSVHSDFFMSTV